MPARHEPLVVTLKVKISYCGGSDLELMIAEERLSQGTYLRRRPLQFLSQGKLNQTGKR